VSLVAEDQVANFIAKVRADYKPYHGLSEEALNEAIFATRPGQGAFGAFLQPFTLIHTI